MTDSDVDPMLLSFEGFEQELNLLLAEYCTILEEKDDNELKSFTEWLIEFTEWMNEDS